MRRYGITLACSMFAVMLGLGTLSAQTGGAMLYANGTVRVNGQNAADSTSVFAGDKVDVTGASAGSINRSGSSVVVSPNSSIQYNPASIELLRGTARVSTSKGMTATAGQIVVSPRDASAKFDVERTGDKVVVVSREGALTVKDGDRTTVVQSGSRAELNLGSIPAPASPPDQVASANFMGQDRLQEHPFYGVVTGVSTNPASLPVCADIMICLRPSVSQIAPCCCPPIVKCQ